MTLGWTKYLKKLGSAFALISLAAVLLAVAPAGSANAQCASANVICSQILAGPEDALRTQTVTRRNDANSAYRQNNEKQTDAHGLPYVDLDELPQEAHYTLMLIKRSGPYPYSRDGVVFGNYERILPRQKRGYYTEYTVRTPGVKHRGARRIIAGKGSTGNPATSGEYYYTADHYRSFWRIRERQ